MAELPFQNKKYLNPINSIVQDISWIDIVAFATQQDPITVQFEFNGELAMASSK